MHVITARYMSTMSIASAHQRAPQGDAARQIKGTSTTVDCMGKSMAGRQQQIHGTTPADQWHASTLGNDCNLEVTTTIFMCV